MNKLEILEQVGNNEQVSNTTGTTGGNNKAQQVDNTAEQVGNNTEQQVGNNTEAAEEERQAEALADH